MAATAGSKRPRDEDTTVTLQCESRAVMPAGIVRQWQLGKLCDAHLRASDGCELFAHRSALAAASEYFNGVYCSEAGEAMIGGTNQGEAHTLELVSSTTLESVISFIYTGECVLSSQDALVSTLEAAAFLGVPGLCKAAEAAIISRISPESCVAGVQLAERYSLETLAKASKRECRGNLTKLDLGELSIGSMADLLKSGQLAVASEEDVFGAIDTWWRAQAEKPPSMKKVLRRLRCRLLTPRFIEDRLLCAPWLQDAEAKDEIIRMLAADPIQPPIPRYGVEVCESGSNTHDWAIPRFSRLLGRFRETRARQDLQSAAFKLRGYMWALTLTLLPANATHESDRTAIYLHAMPPAAAPIMPKVELSSMTLLLHNLQSSNSDVSKIMRNIVFDKDDPGWGCGRAAFGAPSTLTGFCADDTLLISVLIDGTVTALAPDGSRV